jgi:general stress protein 26
MTERNPSTELAEEFSSAEATPTPWSEGRRVLEEAKIYWISTVRADGQPNVTPLFAAWLDGAIYFCTGDGEQKAKNLARNPHCTFTTGCNDVGGLDVVVEGEARKVHDEALLQRLAGIWQSKYDWPWTVKDGAFHDPAEDVTAPVYEVAPNKAFGFGKGEVFSQTRWQF